MLPSLAANHEIEALAGFSLSVERGGMMGEMKNHLNLSFASGECSFHCENQSISAWKPRAEAGWLQTHALREIAAGWASCDAPLTSGQVRGRDNCRAVQR
jgi:hypothetical protein